MVKKKECYTKKTKSGANYTTCVEGQKKPKKKRRTKAQMAAARAMAAEDKPAPKAKPKAKPKKTAQKKMSGGLSMLMTSGLMAKVGGFRKGMRRRLTVSDLTKYNWGRMSNFGYEEVLDNLQWEMNDDIPIIEKSKRKDKDGYYTKIYLWAAGRGVNRIDVPPAKYMTALKKAIETNKTAFTYTRTLDNSDVRRAMYVKMNTWAKANARQFYSKAIPAAKKARNATNAIDIMTKQMNSLGRIKIDGVNTNIYFYTANI